MKPFLLLLLLLAGPARAERTLIVDHDPTARFHELRTWAWQDTGEGDLSDEVPAVHAAIREEIAAQLARHGLEPADGEPDVWVAYHADLDERVVVEPARYGYDFGPHWSTSHFWGPVAYDEAETKRTYREGSLVIDVVHAASGTVVFRGTLRDVLPSGSEPARRARRGIRKLVKRFERMRRQEARWARRGL